MDLAWNAWLVVHGTKNVICSYLAWNAKAELIIECMWKYTILQLVVRGTEERGEVKIFHIYK